MYGVDKHGGMERTAHVSVIADDPYFYVCGEVFALEWKLRGSMGNRDRVCSEPTKAIPSSKDARGGGFQGESSWLLG